MTATWVVATATRAKAASPSGETGSKLSIILLAAAAGGMGFPRLGRGLQGAGAAVRA